MLNLSQSIVLSKITPNPQKNDSLNNNKSKLALSVDILMNLIQLPCIYLTTIIIWLVDVLARVTMTVPTSRNSVDSLLSTAASQSATVTCTVATD